MAILNTLPFAPPDYSLKDNGMTFWPPESHFARFPDDLLIVLSKDGEGNGYSPLADHSDPNDTLYHAETTWMGEISSQEERDDEDGWGYSSEGVPALVLWPVN